MYQTVNAYLSDCEIIEALSSAEKMKLAEEAKAIAGLSIDREKYRSKQLVLSDSKYHKMDSMQDEAIEGIEKLKETEEYQNAIRQDLQRLEAEKQAYLYRKHEAHVGLENLKGMAVISIFAVFSCLFVLIILQFGFRLETRVGYILTAAVAAVTLTILYVKYQETEVELSGSSNGLNKVILLQNKVKIRYVNNTNLLDYLYMKYEVSSARELESLWDGYLKERDIRQKMEATEENLDFHEQTLVSDLKKHHLFDPLIWIHQAIALCNPKEMVEVRHQLIVRRQKLRKQMEFNTNNADNAQKEIKEMVGDYPHYANEILKMVSDYEERRMA